MKISLALAIVISSFAFGCSPAENKTEKTRARQIIDHAIDMHGGERYDSARISFTFRDRYYTALRHNGLFTYTRAFSDSIGDVKDVLTNEGFSRYVNGNKVDLNAEWTGRYTESVNSVWYFALLPFPLADEAVQLHYEGKEDIKGKSYHVIDVSFREEGGGKDFEDVFMYWFDTEDYSMDYMAYSYETNGGGTRFREAINQRQVGGITFYDFINYRPEEKFPPLGQLDSLFQAGQLKEVSHIILEGIEVAGSDGH